MQIFLFILLLIWNFFIIGRPVRNSPATVKIVSTNTKIDSTFLTIKIYEKKYSVSLLGDSITTINISTVDNFISKNIARIQTKKIVVRGEKNVEYSQFKKLKGILKKHEFFTFILETEGFSQ